MNDKELIARLAAKVFELEDQLAKEKESSDIWYNATQKADARVKELESHAG